MRSVKEGIHTVETRHVTSPTQDHPTSFILTYPSVPRLPFLEYLLCFSRKRTLLFHCKILLKKHFIGLRYTSNRSRRVVLVEPLNGTVLPRNGTDCAPVGTGLLFRYGQWTWTEQLSRRETLVPATCSKYRWRDRSSVGNKKSKSSDLDYN